ncbi:uncharacterized protein L3040_006912 [Drepanopeziza brunnea f. sp. 'multigermtubi']|uniref:Uncharacterized protein n=1 Tax=Marssonina brunnea f. sp. multigermtubi (strain MB_m1) TaxID=1072389 RepID=K1W6W1_MARBU|nr:uncharacterized protein MBM_08989 [Drepanopeziza brunnea f. sp. 'multigermtubi' MB_m1]EKD12760.1 hypothetical protein MBM_08989 [Drepanopeziza brunnea f. sp. 'multigermtubi' MB_m1]KAJ5038040.1 hypothetical protein L3040_006912 [Drepanopeziza brunnea f. sp. 'multigermtubi']
MLSVTSSRALVALLMGLIMVTQVFASPVSNAPSSSVHSRSEENLQGPEYPHISSSGSPTTKHDNRRYELGKRENSSATSIARAGLQQQSRESSLEGPCSGGATILMRSTVAANE